MREDLAPERDRELAAEALHVDENGLAHEDPACPYCHGETGAWAVETVLKYGKPICPDCDRWGVRL